MVQFATTLTNAQAGFKTDNHTNSKGQFENRCKKELICATCKQTVPIRSVRFFQQNQVLTYFLRFLSMFLYRRL